MLKLIDKGTSYTIIMEKYGIGRATVSDIKKRSSIMDFRRQTKEMGVVRTVKTISGHILCEKAVELSTLLRPDSNFNMG